VNLNVLLVTTWDKFCGIADHSFLLRSAVEQADPSIHLLPSPEALDPLHYAVRSLVHDSPDLHQIQVVHLNYHAALHSRWTPDRVRELQASGIKVVITFHDTGVPNSDQCKALHAVADAFVIHEPADDLLGAYYWRMGVPSLSGGVGEHTRYTYGHLIVGTVGFDFPWKCWDELARVAASVGWGLLVCAPDMTAEHEQALHTENPWLTVRRGLARKEVLAQLHECDATAFTFSCANTGQSASILCGIGARKPVIAFNHCRQMRALYLDDLGHKAIRWCESFEEVAEHLKYLRLGRFDPMTVALAQQDSWTEIGKRYAGLYRRLVDGDAPPHEMKA
jgi:hypothetical protein